MPSFPQLRNAALICMAWMGVGMTLCHADFVILKDGFTLSGKLEIEGEVLRDPNGKEFWIKKLGGFYLINDKVRRMTFAVRQVAEAHPDPAERKGEGDVIEFRPPLHLTEAERMLDDHSRFWLDCQQRCEGHFRNCGLGGSRLPRTGTHLRNSRGGPRLRR